jgi:NAD(P)-dependent dehydrogenase (short-subunit alcohol dehydrogenase family)
MFKNSMGGEGGKNLDAAVQQIQTISPMGRVGQPDEIATVAVFLASNDSSYITGIEISADGGLAQV